MDYSPPGSSVHGILQARILEWVVISFSRGSSPLRGRIQVSYIVGSFFTIQVSREALGIKDGSWVKNLPAMQKTKKMQVRSLVREDPLKEEMTTHSSILA